MNNYLIFLATILVFASTAFCYYVSNDIDSDVGIQTSIKCYEPVDFASPSLGWKISAPEFKFCGYTFVTNGPKFHLQGAKVSKEDEQMLNEIIENSPQDVSSGISVCFQEGFAFSSPVSTVETGFHCFCRKELCNAPDFITEYLRKNKNLATVSNNGNVIYKPFYV